MTIAVISMIRDNWGGSEELWYSMALEAMRDGHTVVHLSYEVKELHPKMLELIQQGLITYQRPGYIKPGSSQVSRFIQTGINFLKRKMNNPFKKIFAHNPDIVIYNGTCYSISNERTLIAYLQAEKSRFYLIGHLNSDDERPGGEAAVDRINLAYALCKKVFFVSHRSIRIAERHLCRKITNALVVRNPVNLVNTDIVEYPVMDEAPVNFAVVGNLAVIHKGQDVLLSILSQDNWKKENWQLNIYGSGIDEQYLRKLTAFYGLTDKVYFHGRVNDIQKLWKQNHILLMPSRMEGMPLAVVEAMVCGRPCVAADAGGITEWLEENETGFIADAATEVSFGKALKKAWDKRAEWKAMGISAHEMALKLYESQPGRKLLNLITA